MIRYRLLTWLRRLISAAACAAVLVRSCAASEQVDGFVAPYRTGEVATAETGIVNEVLVHEGDTVEAGQPLAKLDDTSHAAQLAIAEKNMQAKGRLQAALAEARLRNERFSKLQELLARGSARQEEIARAQADAEIAAAQLLAIQEDLAVKQLEHQRARVQWERRTVRAPCNGVVLRLHKESGEFIGPGDPQLLTIVQLDPLLAVFPMPSGVGRHMRQGQSVHVRLPQSSQTVAGTVEFVSPVVDGKSNTIRIEVRLQNQQRRFYSGEPCSLLFDDDATDRGPTELTGPGFRPPSLPRESGQTVEPSR